MLSDGLFPDDAETAPTVNAAPGPAIIAFCLVVSGLVPAGAGVSLTVRLAWTLVEEVYDLVMDEGRKDDL
ncbi:hypothetical protein NUBL22018_47960 [Klebsiella variicola]|nr:hypothetical protein NUBL21973_52580 [Klebsiella pneumoniae]GKI51494.1 hypothetical protein NUBL22018_47960 [Klebsiella variicola]GKL53241.1 hypothetical protein NUBL21992_50970 [Klebsiella pneumoniae]GKL73501.1 hypothetical protein NUBL21993_50250 [Klebsiella pneumoniae]GKO26736.1 hypothetical protein MS5935_49750 [Klebsiella pneumoniae]